MGAGQDIPVGAWVLSRQAWRAVAPSRTGVVTSIPAQPRKGFHRSRAVSLPRPSAVVKRCTIRLTRQFSELMQIKPTETSIRNKPVRGLWGTWGHSDLRTGSGGQPPAGGRIRPLSRQSFSLGVSTSRPDQCCRSVASIRPGDGTPTEHYDWASSLRDQ